MDLDKYTKLYEKVKKQAAKRNLPKQRRAYTEWLAHAKQCPRCINVYNARMRQQEALAVERRKAQMPSPDDVMKGLFSSLGLKGGQTFH
jgi:hypothetical protein